MAADETFGVAAELGLALGATDADGNIGLGDELATTLGADDGLAQPAYPIPSSVISTTVADDIDATPRTGSGGA